MTIHEFIYSLITDQIQGPFTGFLRIGLTLLSFVFNVVVRIRALFYRVGIFKRRKVPRPVISVGNIALGGTGKTPLVEYISHYLDKSGHEVAILSRGYKVPVRFGRRELTQDDWHMRDEAMMLKDNLPGVAVLVGPKRYENATAHMAGNKTDIFVLDDGFQHWPLYRDLDIVAIDTTHPWGNGYLIPRGFLREPLTALARADMFILTKADHGRMNVPAIRDTLERFAPGKPIYETVHVPLGLIDLRTKSTFDSMMLKSKKVCSFCGIGYPKSFNNTLTQLGVDCVKNFVFIDHHVYNRTDVEKIEAFRKQNKLDFVLTTQKDAVKLSDFLDVFAPEAGVFAVQIGIDFKQGKEDFFGRLDALLSR